MARLQKGKKMALRYSAETSPREGLGALSSAESREICRFSRGTNARAFDYFGAHPNPDGSVALRLWAPHAEGVSVVGEFNHWDPNVCPMELISSEGVWALTLEQGLLKEGMLYKFCIHRGEERIYKADPFGFFSERAPGTASVLFDSKGYPWQDEGWMRYRCGRFCRGAAERQPINVYELHAGSWKRHADGSFYSYTDLAADLVTYVKQMGYTHVELLPLTEHTCDASWGYQALSYFAPTARYGDPRELMSFVDRMHEAGIGVILDWVPAHFSTAEQGLVCFDGEPLFEPCDPTRQNTPWGSRYFDLSRPQVQSFLISSAVYWAERYHLDGLRVDAVAELLCAKGDGADPVAVSFLQRLNSQMARELPDVMMIAEDSSSRRGVTTFEDGGLGFTLKWNMGWMNDSLSYLCEDPLFRNHHHRKLTFPLTYAFGERYLLPISHDEVVYGKRSLLDRSVGNYAQKFAGTRAYLTYQMTHPGKKLLFMGGELGQFKEWCFEEPLEWFLLDYEMHARLQLFASELNHLYLQAPALWQRDAEEGGFAWIDADNADQSVLSYRRIDQKGRELIVVINFLPVDRQDFLLAVPCDGVYEEILSSDDLRYGGGGRLNPGRLRTEPCMLRQYRRAVRIHLPPMSALILQNVRHPALHK